MEQKKRATNVRRKKINKKQEKQDSAFRYKVI